MKVQNFLIKHNDDKAVIVMPDTEVENFPFLESNLYVSKSKISEKVIFIMTPDFKKSLEFSDISMEIIIKIMKNKTFTFAISDKTGKFIDGYDFDVKIIK